MPMMLNLNELIDRDDMEKAKQYKKLKARAIKRDASMSHKIVELLDAAL